MNKTDKGKLCLPLCIEWISLCWWWRCFWWMSILSEWSVSASWCLYAWSNSTVVAWSLSKTATLWNIQHYLTTGNVHDQMIYYWNNHQSSSSSIFFFPLLYYTATWLIMIHILCSVITQWSLKIGYHNVALSPPKYPTVPTMSCKWTAKQERRQYFTALGLMDIDRKSDVTCIQVWLVQDYILWSSQ